MKGSILMKNHKVDWSEAFDAVEDGIVIVDTGDVFVR